MPPLSRISTASRAVITATRARKAPLLKMRRPARGPALLTRVHTARATADAEGRCGHVVSTGDHPLDLKMSTPRGMGGKEDGQNPEQLFAASYATCFANTLQQEAARLNRKDAVRDARTNATVSLGQPVDRDGFGLEIELHVEGVDDDAVIEAAHKMCPYSRLTREGATVRITKS